ncbi:TPA: hypothetical protein PMB21_001479 [Vibrio cholerae]|nr:hypothetical protein [Vibrio cholerae]
MSIIRAKRERNFSVISNDVWADGCLSWQAMGMLSYILSKPDNWSISPSQLEGVTQGTAKKTGREGVYNILKELKNAGFISTKKGADGSVEYTVFDHPVSAKPNQAKPKKVEPNTANPNEAKPNKAEPTLINTDLITNTDLVVSTDLVPSELETENCHEPALFEIPLKGKTQTRKITKSEIDNWSTLYPNVDVAQQIRNMIGWSIGNPAKQKTAKGVDRFIHAWLSKEQDRGHSGISRVAQSRHWVPDHHDTSWADGMENDPFHNPHLLG